jgi:methylthioribose-1-phosphate isomerase
MVPRCKGARLTAWELMKEKVPMHLIADSAAGLLMQNGKVDVVLYGAGLLMKNFRQSRFSLKRVSFG